MLKQYLENFAGIKTDENMKKLLAELERSNKGLRHRIFGAMCKGELTVKSTVGVGTRVTIEIPKKKGKRR